MTITIETHQRLVVMTIAVLLAVGATTAKAQDTGASSETLAELNALGLQVEVRPDEIAPAAPFTEVSPPAALAPGEALPGARAQENIWDRLRGIFGDVFQRATDRLVEDAIEGIQDACRINLTAEEEGFVLTSVGISLGGVTATFTPTRGFCATAGGLPDC